MEQLGGDPQERLELRTGYDLDDKIQAFAASGKRWPQLTTPELCLLHHRLTHARAVVDQLAAPELARPPRPALWIAPESFGDMLVWLLVTCWHLHGEGVHRERRMLLRSCKELRKAPTAPWPADPSEGFAA